MIHCEHKRVMLATNLQLETQFCAIKGTFVNDTICLMCEDHDGSGEPKVAVENNFNRRDEKEIKAVHSVCTGCPMFHVARQTCNQAKLQRSMPVDTIAQNPTNHCPEGKW